MILPKKFVAMASSCRKQQEQRAVDLLIIIHLDIFAVATMSIQNRLVLIAAAVMA